VRVDGACTNSEASSTKLTDLASHLNPPLTTDAATNVVTSKKQSSALTNAEHAYEKEPRFSLDMTDTFATDAELKREALTERL
jgi:hypothetical protein